MTHSRFSNFHLRLHYHTSCSYRVHKSCSYKVFNLQDFKQNDSRASCSSSNYYTNFREKQFKKKEEKNLEFYESLLAELRLEDGYNYITLLRMTSENFEEIFHLIKDEITEENTKLRKLIQPRL